MATSEQKRQKKLAKKRSKEIAKRKQLAAEKNAMRSIGGQLAAASQGKFHECYIYDTLLNGGDGSGIGAVIVSRFIPDGNVVFACFLIDQFCLGVKDAYARMVSPRQLSEHIQGMREHSRIRQCTPEMAKKCVTEAVRWAAQYGLDPHPDYKAVDRIWPDVDASQSDQEFVFGKDGKPLFIQGPHDSPARVKQVMQALSAHSVDGNDNHTIAASPERNAIEHMDRAAAEQGESIGLDYGGSLVRVDPGE